MSKGIKIVLKKRVGKGGCFKQDNFKIFYYLYYLLKRINRNFSSKLALKKGIFQVYISWGVD